MPERPHLIASPHRAFPSRRDFLRRTGSGFGGLALASILAEQARAEGIKLPANPLEGRPGHFAGKAKSVIWLFMNGGPSQVDTWDYKPALAAKDGQELKGFDKDTGFFTDQVGPLMKSPFKFAQHGQSGTWASEIFPNLSKHVDDMAMIYSCYTHTNNHSPALFEINTGMSRMGFPCVGSWVTYGLGTMNQDLARVRGDVRHAGPGGAEGACVELGRGVPAGRLPGDGLECPGGADGQPRPRPGTDRRRAAAQIDLLNKLNRRHRDQHPHEADLAARIESFELAYRMQMAAPEALDVNREPDSIKKLYGLDDPRCSHFAKQCLMARRLVGRGVRFVQIYSGGMENERSWDGHTDIAKNHSGFAGETDKPIAGLARGFESLRPARLRPW